MVAHQYRLSRKATAKQPQSKHMKYKWMRHERFSVLHAINTIRWSRPNQMVWDIAFSVFPSNSYVAAEYGNTGEWIDAQCTLKWCIEWVELVDGVTVMHGVELVERALIEWFIESERFIESNRFIKSKVVSHRVSIRSSRIDCHCMQPPRGTARLPLYKKKNLHEARLSGNRRSDRGIGYY